MKKKVTKVTIGSKIETNFHSCHGWQSGPSLEFEVWVTYAIKIRWSSGEGGRGRSVVEVGETLGERIWQGCGVVGTRRRENPVDGVGATSQ